MVNPKAQSLGSKGGNIVRAKPKEKVRVSLKRVFVDGGRAVKRSFTSKAGPWIKVKTGTTAVTEDVP